MSDKKKTKKITIRVSDSLKIEMQKAVITSGYGLHGKSQWVARAVKAFLANPNYLDLVENGTEMNQGILLAVESFYLEEDIITQMKQALVAVRTKYPLLEGIQSAFIRACIVYQLMFQK